MTKIEAELELNLSSSRLEESINEAIRNITGKDVNDSESEDILDSVEEFMREFAPHCEKDEFIDGIINFTGVDESNPHFWEPVRDAYYETEKAALFYEMKVMDENNDSQPA